MFRSVVRRFRGMIALYIGVGVLCAALSAGSVVLFHRLVDCLTHPEEGGGVLPLLIAYGVVALAEYLTTYFGEYPLNQLKNGIYQYIRRWALEKVSKIDYLAYQDFGIGRLVQVVESGASAGRDILLQFYLNVAGWLAPGAVMSVFIIGVYNLGIMVGAFLGYGVVFAVTRLLLSKLHSIKEEALISEELLSKTYVRAFMEMVVFRVNRRFVPELARAKRTGKAITDVNTRILMVHGLFFTAFAVLVFIIKVGMIAVGAGRILEGSMTVGTLLALLTLIDRVYQPVAVFNVEYVDYMLNRVAWARFTDLMQAPDDPNLLGGESPIVEKGELVFEGVSFSYGNRQVIESLKAVLPQSTIIVIAHSEGAILGVDASVCLANGRIDEAV